MLTRRLLLSLLPASLLAPLVGRKPRRLDVLLGLGPMKPPYPKIRVFEFPCRGFTCFAPKNRVPWRIQKWVVGSDGTWEFVETEQEPA